MEKKKIFQHFVSQLHQLKGASSFQSEIDRFVEALKETDLPETMSEQKIALMIDPSTKKEILEFGEKGLQFSAEASSLQHALLFDFDEDSSYSRPNNRGKNDLLLKAIGYKNQPLRVLDLTAGLLRDSVFMAQAGCQVTSLERNFLLYLCLAWGMSRAEARVMQNIHLLHRSAYEFLQSQNLIPYDVIYYDPMYPESKSTALPKKEIQFLRDYIGEDKDRDETLQLILKSNVRSRVVVKRHPQDKMKKEKLKMTTNQQVVNFEGKAVVFEVFLPKVNL